MSEIIFFDLPSRDRCAGWSLNPWKIRLVLNYKGLDYKTEWVEYPDIAVKFKSLDITPNPTHPAYTIPAIRLPNGTAIMDSLAIASALEKAHPTPSLNLSSPQTQPVITLTQQLADVTSPWWKAKVPRNLLNPRSAEYFSRERAKRYGMPLDRLEGEGCTAEKLEEAAGVARELGRILGESGGGWFGGRSPSYADFVVVAFLHCLKRVDEEVFEKIAGLEPKLKKLYEACGEWLKRDD